MHIFDQWDADDADAQRRRDAHRDLLKALMPQGLVMIPRQVGDDQVIVETWL